MRFNNKYIVVFGALMLVLCSFGTKKAEAQKKKNSYSPPKIEDLPRIPIDTIKTKDPDTRIILYSNNTWSYYRPSMNHLNSQSAYTENWITEQVFAYKNIELADLPNKIELGLVSNISEYHPPIVGKIISKYGPRRGRNHNGVDIPLKMYEPIYATFDGKVRYSKYNTGGFGNLVIIRHANGLETWSAHLARATVESGDNVKAGQIIGFGGNTGRSRGPHLHFEMRYCDQTFDPEFIVDFESGTLKYQTFVLEKSYFNIRSRASEILDEDDDYSLPMFVEYAEVEGGGTIDLDKQEKQKETYEKQQQAKKQAAQAVYHTIKSGDVLGKLATRYGVSIDQICRLNNITRNTTLRLGRKLRIK